MSTTTEAPPETLAALAELCDRGRHDEVLVITEPLAKTFPACAQLSFLRARSQLALGRPGEALTSFEQTVRRSPGHAEAWSGLGEALLGAGRPEDARDAFLKALHQRPELTAAHNGLGRIFLERGELVQAAEHFRRALSTPSPSPAARHNLGLVQYRSGDLGAAEASFRAVLETVPDAAVTHNELGNVLLDAGDVQGSRDSFFRALALQPGYGDALWNLAGAAADVAEACDYLRRCLAACPGYASAGPMLSGLEACGVPKGQRGIGPGSPADDHPFLRSFRWVFAQASAPDILIHRWAFFDRAMELCEPGRPFYEFGVWRGRSFAYLAAALGNGYGFDSFEGLPEDWHERPAGSYSAGGAVPEIPGGEFVVGRFEDSLPEFFARSRPRASLLHFDADLYSSTLCALTHARPVIDASTVLVFDEFLMHDTWEQDEYRALEEFCAARGWAYDVLAVSFFTKQVAVRLTGAGL